MVMTAIGLGVLCACSTGASNASSFEDKMTLCSNDSIEDLPRGEGVPIDKSKVALVPLNLQREAMAALKDLKVIPLSRDQAEHFLGATVISNGTPHLISACFYSVKSTVSSDPDRFERGFMQAAFDPVYFRGKNTLVAYTFGLAPRKANANPIAVIIWHDDAITDVRIVASAAS